MHVRHFWVVYSLASWLDFLILLLYKTDKTWASISFSFEWLVARYVGAYLWEILWYGIHCHNLFPVVCAFYSLSIDPLGLVSLKAVFSHSLCALGLSQLLFSLSIHFVHSFHSVRLVLVDCGFWFYSIQSLPFLYKMRIVLNPSVCRLSKLSLAFYIGIKDRYSHRVRYGLMCVCWCKQNNIFNKTDQFEGI